MKERSGCCTPPWIYGSVTRSRAPVLMTSDLSLAKPLATALEMLMASSSSILHYSKKQDDIADLFFLKEANRIGMVHDAVRATMIKVPSE